MPAIGFLRCIALIITLSVTLISPALAGETKVRGVLDLIGYRTYLAGFSGALTAAGNDFHGGDTSFAIAWDQAAKEAFPADALFDEIATGMEGQLSEDVLASSRAFLLSELGRRVTKLEEQAQGIDIAMETINSEGSKILSDLIRTNSKRLDAYTSLIDALGAIDSETAAAMNLNFAIQWGMSQSGKLPFSLSETELLALVAAQQDSIRAQIREQIYINFAYTYRDLSDEDLKAYIAFLTSKNGRSLYSSIQLATESVISGRATFFGRRLMDLQGVQEL